MNNEYTKEQQDRIERLSQETASLIQESKDLKNELRMYREKFEESLENTRGTFRKARENMHNFPDDALPKVLECLDNSFVSGEKEFIDLRMLISQEIKTRSETD